MKIPNSIMSNLEIFRTNFIRMVYDRTRRNVGHSVLGFIILIGTANNQIKFRVEHFYVLVVENKKQWIFILIVQEKYQQPKFIMRWKMVRKIRLLHYRVYKWCQLKCGCPSCKSSDHTTGITGSCGVTRPLH